MNACSRWGYIYMIQCWQVVAVRLRKKNWNPARMFLFVTTNIQKSTTISPRWLLLAHAQWGSPSPPARWDCRCLSFASRKHREARIGVRVGNKVIYKIIKSPTPIEVLLFERMSDGSSSVALKTNMELHGTPTWTPTWTPMANLTWTPMANWPQEVQAT